MKKLNEVYYRVIELKNKERVVVVPLMRNFHEVKKEKNLVIEDFYDQTRVYLFNLTSRTHLVETVNTSNYNAYKLKKATPDEQEVVANIKRVNNKAFTQAKNAYRQWLREKELTDQLKKLEQEIKLNKEEMEGHLAQIKAFNKEREVVAGDYIIRKQFDVPNRELVSYDFLATKNNNVDFETAKYLLRYTKKPIKYCDGGYSCLGASARRITREKALRVVDERSWVGIKEYEDYVEVSDFSAADLW